MKALPCLLVLALLAASPVLEAQTVDSDQDGLSDAAEQALLLQFAPSFMVGQADCSNLPAEFTPNVTPPAIAKEDGTIYGEVFHPEGHPADIAEVHFYHLWRRDCGGHGHPLDAEHVAALLHRVSPGEWQATFWYAAAHEDTVCDVSQIARAATLNAEHHGPTVWISPGKHASYLDEVLCRRGCGADRCEAMTPLKVHRLINLGEPGYPMNGAIFLASTAWPLAGKMQRTNFPAEPLARLNRLPQNQIAFFHAGKHPAQGIIAISSSTEQSLASGTTHTQAAIGQAGDQTGHAITAAGDSTGNALGKSYCKTIGALGTSARHVGRALGIARDQLK